MKSHSLDNLGAKLEIDMSGREKYHGALVDCNILALVYFELISGQKQKRMFDESGGDEIVDLNKIEVKARCKTLGARVTKDEADAHKKFILSICGQKNWDY